MNVKVILTTLFFWVLFIGLTSCSSLQQGSASSRLIPTEKLPTVIAMTVEALITQGAVETQRSTQNRPEPSSTPTEEITRTFTPTPLLEISATETAIIQPKETATKLPAPEIPYAQIQFLNPGTLSKVISPIRLHAFLLPGDSGRATIELFGEDGRLMYRKLFVFSSPSNVQANLRTDIEYEITGVAETATLVIRTDDSYGRVKEVASTKLILLALGDSDLNPAGDHLAPIVIQEPTGKVLVREGKLLVSGLVRTDSDQPLLVELITTDGKVIGTRLAGISPGEAGDHRLYATEITFSVEAPTWVRVTVSERINGSLFPANLTSVEVLLSP